MNKKIIALILAVILIYVLYLIWIQKRSVYSTDPKDWILAKPDKTFEIDVGSATAGRGYYDGINQVYKDSQIFSSFGYAGWYYNNYFTNAYVKDGVMKIRFGPSLMPGDGVIDVFVVETFREQKPYLYFFVDDDWKNQVGNTNIIWGANFQNIKQLTYNEVEKGVYFDSVPDDINRFIISKEGPSQLVGGVVVGNINLADWNSADFSNKIVIKQV